MKKLPMVLAVCAVTLCSTATHAQTNGDIVDYCMNYAHAVNVAIADRNTGFSPQQAFSQIEPILKNIPDTKKKDIINKVFFDPSLAQAMPDDQMFIGQVIGLCENNWKPVHQFKPLR